VPDVVARVAPEARRLFHVGPEGARVLIVGGAPGKAYQQQEWSSGA
jgi:uracil-DNA glycosylase